MVLEETELKILKALYNDGYRYLARDDCRLYAFRSKPLKKEDEWYDDTPLNWANLGYVKVLFPHIKREDKEPTSIERLLNE